jgi:hypothetical protein
MKRDGVRLEGKGRGKEEEEEEEEKGSWDMEF